MMAQGSDWAWEAAGDGFAKSARVGGRRICKEVEARDGRWICKVGGLGGERLSDGWGIGGLGVGWSGAGRSSAGGGGAGGCEAGGKYLTGGGTGRGDPSCLVRQRTGFPCPPSPVMSANSRKATGRSCFRAARFVCAAVRAWGGYCWACVGSPVPGSGAGGGASGASGAGAGWSGASMMTVRVEVAVPAALVAT